MLRSIMLCQNMVSPTLPPFESSTLDLYKATQRGEPYVEANPSISKITNYPQATWIGDWVNNPSSVINSHKSNAGTKTLFYVLYAIPFRDNGNFSAGGFQTDQQYYEWIENVKNGIGSSKAIVILEPDALGLINALDQNAQTRRYNLIAGAVNRLKQCVNLKLYIDMGLWVGPADAATRLDRANIAEADGFSINVSAHHETSYCFTRGDAYATSLRNLGINGKKYVIDTSRNGNGELQNSYPGSAPWFDSNQTWCNPPGRALGITPRYATEYNQPDCYALLWVKNAGDSDGNFPRANQNSIFNSDAPIAGTFWLEYALQLCTNTS